MSPARPTAAGRPVKSICASRVLPEPMKSSSTTPTLAAGQTARALTRPAADPYQVMIVGNPANASGNTAAETLNIALGLANGTAAPGRIKVAVEDDGAGSTINAFQTNSARRCKDTRAPPAPRPWVRRSTSNTPACGTPRRATLESYSSEGGAPILFDVTGTRLAAPVVRQKPDFVGPDGVNDTFLGFTLASAGHHRRTCSRLSAAKTILPIRISSARPRQRRMPRHRGVDAAGKSGGDAGGNLPGAAH